MWDNLNEPKVSRVSVTGSLKNRSSKSWIQFFALSCRENCCTRVLLCLWRWGKLQLNFHCLHKLQNSTWLMLVLKVCVTKFIIPPADRERAYRRPKSLTLKRHAQLLLTPPNHIACTVRTLPHFNFCGLFGFWEKYQIFIDVTKPCCVELYWTEAFSARAIVSVGSWHLHASVRCFLL